MASTGSRSPRLLAAPESADRRCTAGGPTPGRCWRGCSPGGSSALWMRCLATGSGAKPSSSESSRCGKRLRNDDVVMSVLRNAPELTMVYTAERLGTSQQIMIDTCGQRHQTRAGRGECPSGRTTGTRRDVPARRPLGNPVETDRRGDPRHRSTRCRTRALPERIPRTMTGSTALNQTRRSSELGVLADGDGIDVIVIGGGITGTGIALDAATRGLTRGAGREARPGVRHQQVELQAGARRAALPCDGQRRHRAA